MKKIILSEEQSERLAKILNEETYTEPTPQNPSMKKTNAPFCIDPEKVKIVKKFLDKGFKKGTLEKVGANGLPQKVRVVGMMSSNGDVLKNMYIEQLHDLLIDRFQNMFTDTTERSLFLKQVMDDWFDDKISVHGLLSKNSLMENVTIEDVNTAAKEANLYPSEAQKEAGNYKMGHISIKGMEISIENPKGSRRYFKDPKGVTDSITMQNHYGYFRGTSGNGKDGDAVDVFIGEDVEKFTVVYVVDQYVNDEFDESKVMLGFMSKDDAKDAYLDNYSEEWDGMGEVTGVSLKVFKDWLYRGNKQRKPFSDYVKIKRKKLEESVINEEEYNEIVKIAKMFSNEAASELADKLSQDGIDAYSEGPMVYAIIERDAFDDNYVIELIGYCKRAALDYYYSNTNKATAEALQESFLDISPLDVYKNFKSTPTPKLGGHKTEAPSFEGWKPVKKGYKSNLQNEETGELLSNEWYDFFGYMINGLAIVGNNSGYNLIDEQGNLVLPEWHEDVISDTNGETYTIVDGKHREQITREELLNM